MKSVQNVTQILVKSTVPTLVPWNCRGLVVGRLVSQVPIGHARDIWTNQLFY